MCKFGRHLLSVITGLAVFGSILSLPMPALAGPAPVLTTYVPIPEDDISAALNAMAATSGLAIGTDIQTTISLTISTENAVVYYDHWEDGFESDIANPVQSSTQIWGDNDATNGIPPGYAVDVFASGSVVVLDNGGTIATPRSAAVQAYDGRDKVASNRGFALTRAGWEATYGTLHAGAVAAFDTSKFGTSFSFPIGVNIASNGAFEYTALSAMASQDGTTVWIDSNGDGSIDSSQTIDEGETIFINGGISAGGTLTSSGPVQAFLLTGDIGATFEGRWYELFPNDLLSDSYLAAAGTTEVGTEPAIFLHNPGSSAITIDVTLSTSTDSIVVPAGSTVSYLMPNGSGGRFMSPGNTFHALSATGAMSTGASSENDWGYTLVPESLLTSGVLVGWGPGATNNSNMSPVWVAAVEDTTIYVDYDGVVGNDTAIVVSAFESVAVYDPTDSDMTGSRIYTLDGTRITAAWGQDPATASPGTPALDLGTAIIPATAIVVEKTASLLVDADSSGEISPGDTVEFEIYILDASALSLTAVSVVDDLPVELVYVEDSTTLNAVALSDDATGTPFPLDGLGHTVPLIGAGASVTFSFSAQILDPWPAFKTSVSNQAIATALEAAGTDTVVVPVKVPALSINKSADNAGPVAPGDSFNYEIEVANTGNTAQYNVSITDTLPTSVTLDSATLQSLVDGSSGNVLDDVSAATYGVNAGSLNWATAWVEVETTGAGAGAGDVRVAAFGGANRLAIRNGNTSLTRDFDGSSYDQMTLSLDVSRQGLDDTSDYVALQVSDDGGSSWVELQRFTGPATDSTFQSYSYDISRLSGATLSVRLSASSSLGDNDNVYFDNIQVQALERVVSTNPAGTEPNLANGLTLYPGEIATVAIAVTVNAGVAGSTTIANTATASSDTDGPDSSTVEVPVQLGSIGDMVFADIDGNSTQDSGDDGIESVTVELLDAAGDVVATAVTDATGNYEFSGLEEGSYTVRLVASTLPTNTTTHTAERDAVLDGSTPVTLAVAQDVVDADFGLQPLGSIGDTVFADADGDGIQGAGENGIAGVTVELVQAGTVIGTDSTSAAGTYGFPALPAGSYTVRIVGSTLPSNTTVATVDRDATADGTTNVVLAPAQDVNDADFGYQPLGAIGDTIFADVNGDGTQDASDVGIEDVTVELLNSSGVVVAADTTNSSGIYGFSDLAASDYTVRVDPTSLPVTTNTQTADPDAVVNNETTLNLSAGLTHTAADFGYQPLGSIGDTVFADNDGNGTQNGTEPGLDNVTVELVQGGSIISSTTTGGSGGYSFDDLPAGSYTVQVDLLSLPSDTNTATADPDTTLDGSTLVPLLAAATVDTADFGFQPLGSIGNTIYRDVNGDGTQGAGDAGIETVTVELRDGSGALLETQVTNTAGHYEFVDLPVGAYTVRVVTTSLPNNTITQTADRDAFLDNETTISLTAAGVVDDADFGYQPLGSIGDTVFADLNGDGIQGVGDVGIENVSVELLDAVGNVVSTELTDVVGNYEFSGLSAGDYSIRIVSASLPENTDNQTAERDATFDNETSISLLAGVDIDDADFGYQPHGSIGDTVYQDLNGNGVQDAGDDGIENVTVELVDGSGAVLSTDSTDASGIYGFIDLPAGSYTVRIGTATLPTTVVTPTGDPDGSLDSVTDIALNPAQDVVDADFGYQPLGSIGDTVFADVNGDGVQDAGDAGIENVTVQLLDVSGTVVGSTVTNGFGTYSFGSLASGTYTVRIVAASLPVNTTTQTADPDATMDAETQVILVPSGAVDTADFGFQPLGSIGDTVFADIDGDGVQDVGDGGIELVMVELLDAAGDLVASDVTDISGVYGFEDLPAGSYTVRVDRHTLPINTNTATADRDATLDSETVVVLAPGVDVVDADFGFQPLGSIGDTVFADIDGDGVQDVGDGGIELVMVELLDAAGDLVASDVTGISGVYGFEDLPAGSYTVRVVALSLPANTTSQSGDPDSTLDGQTVVVLSPAGQETDADFGYQPLGSIGDTIFADIDGDGVQDASDAGIENVTVELLNIGNTVVATDVTDVSGVYGFTGLAAGSYTVRVVASTLPANVTTQTADRDATLDNETAVLLVAGALVEDADFGYQPLGSIGDTIFADIDGSGTQDVGDAGIENVTVELLNPSGAVVASDVTDGAGVYGFADLPAATYTVRVDGSTLPVHTNSATADPDTTVDGSTTLTLAPAQDVVDADFGFRPLGSIGDTIFADINGDGVQDASDAGIENVTVQLLDAVGTVLLTETTDVSGTYLFTSIPAGSHTIRVLASSLPANTTSQSGDPDATLDGQTVVVLSPAGQETDADFGYQPLGSIGDTVFVDVNGDGTQDPADTGVSGASVELLNVTGTVMATTSTDVSGAYVFSGLEAGDYTIRVVSSSLPNGVTTPTGDRDGVLDSETSLTLASGQAIDDADFAYQSLGSIGDTIYRDLDGDGNQGATDAGLFGVTVELLNVAGTVISTETTDVSGVYGFAGLPAGDYTVRVMTSSLPASTTTQTGDRDSTLDSQTAITLAPAQMVSDADFGYQPLGSIGDTIFADLNGNGSQDVGDAGIENVTVELLDAAGVSVAADSTDVAGLYEFVGLAAGDYTVQVDVSTLPSNTTTPTADRDATLDNETPVDLSGAGTVGDADFGYQPLGSIGDTIFADIDGDGVQDGGDAGISGVTVNLLDAAGLIVATDSTDGSGVYRFTGLVVGDYTVQVDVSTLPLNTNTQTADPDASLDSQTSINLPAGSGVVTADFGYQPLSSIGDLIYEDLNGNGIQDPADRGIDAVTIELFDATGNALASMTTDISGYYQFSGLQPGTYTVGVVANSLPASTNTQTADRDPVNDNQTTVNLGSAQVVEDADFGYQSLGGIGDRIWSDYDGDGAQDATEPGLAGITVDVLDAASNLVATTTTTASGGYFFGGLPAGDYTIQVVTSSLPNNTVSNTGDRDGTFDSSTTVTLSGGGSVLGADFGYQPLGSIGDTIFADIDGNGIQDAGDAGLAGVTVRLIDVGGAVVATDVTNGSGDYIFANLPAAAYVVEVDESDLPSSTTTNTADPDGLADSTTAVTLLPGVDHLNADFGYQPLGVIRSVVWTDLDGDGFQNGSETGVAGVTVELLDSAGNQVETTTTSPTGEYMFIDLPGGDYTVQVDPASLPTNLRTQTGDLDGIFDDETIVHLPPGGLVTTPAFGYQPRGVIGDTIFVDVNGDGVQDPSDSGISGVTIELVNTTGAVIATEVTDGSGIYGFSSLVAGSYVVRVDATTLPAATTTQTADPDATIDNETSVSLAPGQVVDSADFGYEPDPTVGNITVLVFADHNGDSTQNGIDPDLSGVTVNLVDPAGAIVTTAFTGVDGTASFLGLTPGDFMVVVDPATLPSNTRTQTADPDAVIDHAHDVTVVAGTTDASSVFGYQPLGSIAAVVFADVDGNGVQNGSEAPLPGVSVQLLNSVGNVLGSQITDVAGSYVFRDLPAGEYSVRVVQSSLPANAQNQTADPDAVRDNETSLTLSVGEHAGPVVYGYQPLGSASGTIFNDANSNAVHDGAEATFELVTVELLNNAGAVVETTVTDADGNYRFDDLADGDYTVRVDTASLPATMTVQTADPDPALDSSTTVIIANANSVGDNDFGYRPVVPPALGTISSSVWEDLDGDGSRDDGELPLAGVTVELLDPAGSVVATAVSADNGDFSFTGLPAGDYTIRIGIATLPATVRTQTGDPDTTLDSEHLRTLGVGEDAVVAPFGYQPDDPDIAEVTGVIFDDADRDSIRDPGEVAVAGATVILFNESGVEVARTTTDAGGNYHFDNLAFGIYEVELIMPSGYTLSPETSAPDGSDFDTNRRFGVVLSPGIQSEIGFAGIQQVNQPTTTQPTTTQPTTTSTAQPTTTTTAVTITTTTTSSSQLPLTGSNSGNLVLVGLLMIGAGGLVLASSRRRRGGSL